MILSLTYLSLVRILSRRFAVFAIDPPGSGLSKTLAAPWGLEAYSAWLMETARALGLERFVLVGHSNSGAIATRFAADHPERVSHLILADTIGSGPDVSPLRTTLGRALDAGIEAGLSVTAFPHLLLNLMTHTPVFWHQVRLAMTCDLRALAGQVRVPTLLAWGRRDHTMPPRAAGRLSRHFPLARTRFSARGSHDWIITRPHEFGHVLGAFVDESSDRPRAPAWS